MNAFVTSFFLMLLRVFAMQNSPNARLNVEYAVSTLHLLPYRLSLTHLLWPRSLYSLTALPLASEGVSMRLFLRGFTTASTPLDSENS